jgi:NTE family protein
MTKANGRALVLGGGGVVGIAWETGLLVGLRDGGIDVTDADLIVGTSAGSTVGSQVAAGRDLDELLATQLGPSDGRMERLAADIDVAAALEFWGWLAAQTEFGMAELREIGQRSLAARTPSVEARLEMVEARLGLREWPDRALRLTAIDCETGEFVWWDRSGPATLVQAVASSSAVPVLFPPVEIAGRHYYDGGLRSPTCADLAVGYERVLIIAPISSTAEAIGHVVTATIAAETAAIEDAGGRVLCIHPDAPAMEAFGPNSMDPGRRTPAAEAGRRQGLEFASAVSSLWGKP